MPRRHQQIVSESNEDVPSIDRAREKDPAAVSLGRRGGLKGGVARAAKLSASRRSEIARIAAQKRWHSADDTGGE